MKRQAILIPLFFLILTPTHAQHPLPALSNSDIEGLEVTENREYISNTLWGYINGGADLYLEYGFDKLLLQRISYQGNSYKVEIYRMKKDLSARGIYSMFRYNCSEQVEGIPLSCWYDYQVLMLAGTDYISISNESGTAAEKAFCGELAKAVYAKAQQDYWKPGAPFDKEELKPFLQKLKIFTGPLALQNNLPEWEPLFEGFEDYTVVMLPFSYEGKDLRLAQMTFTHEEQASMVLESLSILDALKTDGSVGISADKKWMVKYGGPMGIFLLQSLNEPLTEELKLLLE